MTTKQTLATSKIIVLVVFICAAIMSSLFIYQLRHQAKQSGLANENTLIFPAARDIKPFELVNSNNTKFTEKDLYQHWTLLFFGFTHCASVCPTTLDLMNRVYQPLHAAYPNLQVVLISLDPQRDSTEALARYTHGFNSAFIGVSGKIQALRQLQSQLGIYSERDATASDNYQIQHTSSILLINPQGKWAGLFKFGLTPDQLIKAFEDSMHFIEAQPHA